MIAQRNAAEIPIEIGKGNITGFTETDNGNVSEYIYLIRCEDSSFYKIGITNNLEKRIRALQVGCPYELEYTFWIKYDENTDVVDIEYCTHIEMGNCRVRGEWYKLSEKDAHQLAGRLAHPTNPKDKAIECSWKAEGWTTAYHTDEGEVFRFV